MWPSFKIAMPITPDVGTLSSKFEHCMVFRFQVNDGTGETYGLTDGDNA